MGEVYKRGGKWWIRYTGLDGRTVRRSTKQGTSEKLANQALADAEKELIHRRLGFFDGAAEKLRDEGEKPLEDSLSLFCQHLEACGCTAMHVDHRRLHIRAAAKHSGWALTKHVAAKGAVSYLSWLSKQPGRYHGTQTAPRTVKEHCVALKSFTRWMAAEEKLLRDPLLGLKPPSAPRQHSRRALSHEE